MHANHSVAIIQTIPRVIFDPESPTVFSDEISDIVISDSNCSLTICFII